MKITLKKSPIKNGRLRLALTYYPPLLNPANNKETAYENLQLFLYAHPKNTLETQHNQETEQLAENIRARRLLTSKVNCTVSLWTTNASKL